MKTLLLAVVASLIAVSCTSPEKTLAKLHRENPELFDTIRTVDTALVYIEAEVVETSFVATPADTIVIERDRIRVRYVDLPGDTVWIEATAKDTTVAQPIVVTKYAPAIIKRVNVVPWWVYALIVALLALLFIVSLRR